MNIILPGALIITLSACEAFQEEEKTTCLPTNMTATIIQGFDTKKIIADFHYLDDSKLIDHITRSDHQTHYFEYDEEQRLKVVRKVKVQEKLQEEMWFEYSGNQIPRVDLVLRHLDYTFLEPVDSVYSGYTEFTWEGGRIISEKRFEILNGLEEPDLTLQAQYEYDGKGNILRITSSWSRGPEQTVNLSYDEGKHPFSGLSYYFDGESYVNNVLSRTESDRKLEYTYEIELNVHDYPEIIYEKLGSSNTRIIRYTYQCR